MLALKMAIEIEKSLMYLRALKKLPASQLQAEARLNRKLASLFEDVAERTINEMIRLNRMPSDDVSRMLIINKILGAKEDYNEVLSEEALAAAQYGRNRVVSDLQKLGLNIAFNEFSKTVRDRILQNAFQASEHTINRVAGDVMANIASSYEKGLGIDEAAEELKKVFYNIQDYEAKRIARTEINSFQNEGAFITEQEIGIQYHIWYTALDERVRDQHVELHGQITRVGEPFSNGLRYPGEKVGDIKQWINCRCRVIPFNMPEGKRAPDTKRWFYQSDLIDI